MKKLYRSRENSMIAGVCSGLGNYLGIDPTIVRLVIVLLAFYHFLGVWVYVVLAILIPQAPEGFDESTQAVSLSENNQTVKVIGGGLILLGLLALVSSLDISLFSWMRLENFWPALIVLLGVLLLVRGFASEE
jgi:phage shock protein C